MPTHLKRTPRACERCRLSRRRCEPPYPCRQCVASGITCEVRAKPRPQRHQRRPHRSGVAVGAESSSAELQGYIQAYSSDTVEPRRSPASQQNTQGDTYKLLKDLVQQMLQERYNYHFECTLVEPQLCLPVAVNDFTSPHEGFAAQPQLPLNSAQALHLLQCSAKFLGWQSPQLIDVEELYTTLNIHLFSFTDLSSVGISKLLERTRLPVDTIALVFASLALGAIATGEPGHSRFYFEVSNEMVKYSMGQSTVDLCLAYFLQHLLALRFGTSNYAQGIISQAIHVARVLGLKRNSHGNRGLLLFLLIYIADQYGSLQHNTEPLIQASDLEDRTFKPLIQAEPELQALVELVTINGHAIELSYKPSDLLEDEMRDLEAKIGYLCWQRKVQVRPGSGNYRKNYDLTAHIHMLCCRLKIRAPRLAMQSSWLLSLSTCLHAAQGVLTAYLQLYRPVLDLIATRFDGKNFQQDKLSTPSVASLAVTWRQVKRIMSSLFVVFFAYWHGEILYDETSRFTAIARLLLEYPRWRWGKDLDEAVQTLVDISTLSNLSIYKHMQTLLPERSDAFLRSLCDRTPLTKPDSFVTTQPGPIDNAFSNLKFWPTVDAYLWCNDFQGFDISMIDGQNLLGFAENMNNGLNG